MGRVRSEELKQTMIESIPIDSCIKRWGMASHPDVFCAAHDHGSICDGDSGGPAVHKADGKWTVHGIVSTGPRPCNWSISPQGFVKVSAYIKDFIEPYMDPTVVERMSSLVNLEEAEVDKIPEGEELLYSEGSAVVLYMVPDIAIIELVEKVNMTTTIQPACLPKSGEELPEGSKLYATGWGDVE
ncbi:chymotrypsin-like protease CTRL-1, partial [Ixodes scapularis]